MLVLDENIREEDWRELRRRWVRARKIGEDIGRAGMDDREIIPLLHRLKSVTLFTEDVDYYQRRLCHPAYCLVYLAVKREHTAETIRRFLRHRDFRTWAQRKGRVIRVSPDGIRAWRVKRREAEDIPWE